MTSFKRDYPDMPTLMGGGQGGDDPGFSPMRSLDRRVVGEIIQRIPADHYLLVVRSHELGGTRWRRCEIGDLNGPGVVQAIADGSMCLCLRDIGDVLRHRLGSLGFSFPEATMAGERISHGLVVASGGLELTLTDRVGSGMLHPLEGSVRLTFVEGAKRLGDAPAEWAVDIGSGRDFHWRAGRPRRFETGPEMTVVLTRAVLPPTAAPRPWRLDHLLDAGVERVSALVGRVFGPPERWATSLIGTAPIGGVPAEETLPDQAEYRLVRRPSRHFAPR